jgi:hypothetical protein
MQNIDVVNDVLLLSGERPVVSLVSPVGRKGALVVSTAIEDIILLNTNWTFLQDAQIPISVTDKVVTHGELREISSVTYKKRTLEPVKLDDLGFVMNSFARLDDDHIQLSDDLSAVASDLRIVGTKSVTYDISDPQATLPLPDRFRALLVVQATYRMAVDHLGDMEQAQMKQREFQAMARRMIIREDGMGDRNRTMYRRRRHYGR